MRETILFYNPISTSPGKQRLPMSLMSIASMVAEDYEIEFVDGNLIADPTTYIIERVQATNAKLLAVTTMPGPQLFQAIPVCKAIKQTLPDLTIIWGGYFPSNHHDVVMRSDYIDYVIVGQGETAFRKFVDTFYHGGSMDDVPSLVHHKNGTATENLRAPFVPLNNVPWYPYNNIEVEQYVGSSYLGKRVLSHHSSWGCPFACNFCAVVPLAQRRWLAESGERVGKIVSYLKQNYNIDGLEFHDMDFFVNEGRTAEIAEQLIGQDISWWGLGRVDTLLQYSDATFGKMKRSGLRMIFMGAESGSDETLKLMNKGGNSGVAQTVAIVERMKEYGIIPELSFVLGNPPDPLADIEQSIRFIRKIKNIYPETEIIIYLYTPVPQTTNDLLQPTIDEGFRFPETLDEWTNPTWQENALRRNPGTRWSQDHLRLKIRNFEVVLNAYYPTATDMRLKGTMRRLLQLISSWRFKTEFYSHPYELKALQRLLQYRRPETMGF